MASNLAHWKANVKSGLFSPGTISDTISASHIEAMCRESGYAWRRSFWSPMVTVKC
ncbi:MAG: hypothetical protein HJJLKODD_01362 [Phycisphaerae bacterium]|nr:hypothetical protein [Phycisphaerae bacterium]